MGWKPGDRREVPHCSYRESAYDAASNRVTLTDPESGATHYTYDTLNRLTGLNDFQSHNFTFSYDALSRRTQLTRPNGVNTNYSYDNVSRLLSVLHQVGSTTVDGASYTYDSAGNRTAKTDHAASVTSNYGYDAIYQLTGVSQGSTTTESYTYDTVGNRLSSLGVSPYAYNSSNQLTSTPSTSYTYDSNGSTLTKVDSSGTTTYNWDYVNQLSSVALPASGGTVSFKYDPFGRRIQKSAPSGTVNYLYDGQNLIEEVDNSGNVLARYTQGSDFDEELSELGSGTTSYYEPDGLGTVTSLSNSTGALANTYSDDSFGKSTASNGSLTNPFRYTGRESDSETGLYYYRARYYDPNSGRFLSEDPLGFYSDDTNFYTYVENDPTYWVDPSGMQVEAPVFEPTPVGPGGGGEGGVSIIPPIGWDGETIPTDPWGRAYSTDPTSSLPALLPPLPTAPPGQGYAANVIDRAEAQAEAAADQDQNPVKPHRKKRRPGWDRHSNPRPGRKQPPNYRPFRKYKKPKKCK